MNTRELDIRGGSIRRELPRVDVAELWASRRARDARRRRLEVWLEVIAIAIGTLVGLFILGGVGAAFSETVGETTVAQFRQAVQSDTSGWYLSAFSKGAMVGAGPFTAGCRDHTVGELGAFLRFTAKPETPLFLAVLQFFLLEKDCHRMTDSETRQVWGDGKGSNP